MAVCEVQAWQHHCAAKRRDRSMAVLVRQGSMQQAIIKGRLHLMACLCCSPTGLAVSSHGCLIASLPARHPKNGRWKETIMKSKNELYIRAYIRCHSSAPLLCCCHCSTTNHHTKVSSVSVTFGIDSILIHTVRMQACSPTSTQFKATADLGSPITKSSKEQALLLKPTSMLCCMQVNLQLNRAQYNIAWFPMYHKRSVTD
jgi:hypothetical protein